jgi:hypothetical protein
MLSDLTSMRQKYTETVSDYMRYQVPRKPSKFSREYIFSDSAGDDVHELIVAPSFAK